MSFFGFANVFAMRVSLSVAIVSMVNTTSGSNNSDIGTDCPLGDMTDQVHYTDDQYIRQRDNVHFLSP